MRPANGTYGNLYCEYKGAANKNYQFKDCGKICVFRLAEKYNVQEGQVNHPFKSEEIFKEKYIEKEPTILKSWLKKYFINVFAISSTYACTCNIWLLLFIYTCIYSVNG